MAAPVDDTLLLAYPDMYDITQADAAWGTEQGGQVRYEASLLFDSTTAYLNFVLCCCVLPTHDCPNIDRHRIRPH